MSNFIHTGDPLNNNAEMLTSKRIYLSEVGDESIACPAPVTGKPIVLIQSPLGTCHTLTHNIAILR